MQFELMIKTVTYDTSIGKSIAESIESIGTASLEQVHAWLSTGDNRIWNKPVAAVAGEGDFTRR